MLPIVLIAAIVGFLIGSISIGGILLIPALQTIADLDIHRAAATSLFIFAFAGLLGTLLFQLRGSIVWQIAKPLAFGALVFSFLGSKVASFVAPKPLTFFVAAIVTASGLLAFKRFQVRDDEERSCLSRSMLFYIGGACGFLSGLSGAGGPVFLVPVLLFLGVRQSLQSGRGKCFCLHRRHRDPLENLMQGAIDFNFALIAMPPLLVGVACGIEVAHRLPLHFLKVGSALVCIFVGIFMFVQAVR